MVTCFAAIGTSSNVLIKKLVTRLKKHGYEISHRTDYSWSHTLNQTIPNKDKYSDSGAYRIIDEEMEKLSGHVLLLKTKKNVHMKMFGFLPILKKSFYPLVKNFSFINIRYASLRLLHFMWTFPLYLQSKSAKFSSFHCSLTLVCLLLIKPWIAEKSGLASSNIVIVWWSPELCPFW